MPKWIRDFGAYLNAVFVESQRRLFTAFDVVGIVLFLFPHLAERLTKDVSLVRITGAIIFLVSFVLANFTLYRKTARENSLVKLQPDSFGITAIKWIERSSTDSGFRIADKIGVSFRVFLECTNPLQFSTTVKLTIHSIHSEWETSFNLASIPVEIHDHQQGPDGRLRLAALESKRVQIRWGIPFDGPNNKLDFGYLGSLSKMVVVLAVEQPNQKTWYLPIAFDTIEMHQRMKNHLIKNAVDHLEMLHRGQRILMRDSVQKEISTVVDIIDKLRID